MRLSFLRRRTWKKHLAMAVTVGLLAGAYAPGAMAADYSNKQIKGSLTSDQKTFGAAAVTQAEDGTLIYDLGEAMNFVNTSNAATVTNTIPSNLLVKNDVNIIVKGGDFGVNGISAGYSNPSYNKDGTKRAVLTFDGNVTMRNKDVEGGWAITGSTIHGGYANYAGARWQPNAVRAGLLGDITFNGALDIAVKGSGLVTDPYYVAQNVDQYGTATINVNGDVTIDTPQEYTEAYYSVANYGGTINVNTDGTNVGDSKVVLNGNIITMRDTEGEATNPYFYRSGRTNIALTNKDSVWNGVIDNTSAAQTGEVNLWLQNAATWNHQAMSLTGGITLGVVPYPSNEHYGQYDSISHVNNLVGGKSAESSGYLYQKDSAAIDIAYYSGYTTVFYEHTNSGVNASDYAAGDITIQKAAADSGITLVTANNNVKDDQINLVLNALAGKLTYVDYSNNPDNLDATVKIASGLTADSITVKSGNIVFDSMGKGGYTNKVSEFKTTLTGDAEADADYKVAGVLLEDGTYKFTEDSKIAVTGENARTISLTNGAVIDATGKTLDLNIAESTKSAHGIFHEAAETVNVKADALNINIKSTNNGNDGAQGIRNLQGDVVIDADVNIDVNGTSNTMGIYNKGNVTVNGGLKVKVEGNNGGYAQYGASGIYATSSMGSSKGGLTDVKGKYAFEGNANGIYANSGGSVVNVEGGSIKVAAGQSKGYAALIAEDATINMNVVNGEATNNKVEVEGNVVVSTGATNGNDIHGIKTAINLGLTTADSALHGAVYNAFPEEGVTKGDLTFTGEANLWLQNGATWNNEVVDALTSIWGGAAFAGSHVTTFKGGASAAAAGNIYQKDSNALTIDNYSGVTNIFYAHNGDGSTAENYTAGDTIIKHAEAGSVVNLITNGDGSAAADINVVANILSALAGKLTYANYVDGERNLTGTVKLAAGLTTDSVTWAVNDIVFDANSGQGGINKDAPIDFPEAPEEQEYTNFNSGLNGSTNLEYVYGGVSQEDGSYKFTENTTINVSQGAAVTADNEVKVDAQGQTLTLNVQPTDDGTAYGIMQTQAKDVNITAGTLEIKVLGGNGNEGIRLDNTDTENTAKTNIKGNTDITLQGSASSKGITVNGNSQLNIQGDVTIRNNSSSTGEAAGALAVGIYAGGNDSGKSAVVNVNGATSLTGAGTGVAVVGSASEVNLNGAVNISTSFDNMVAVVASSGTANINMASDGPSNNTVKLNGNLLVTRDADKMGDTGYQSVINVNMDNASSSWTGVAFNQFDEATPVSLFALRRAVASTGAINLSLSNGAVWNNEVLGIVPEEAATFTGSHITNLNGGTSYSSSGYIYQKDSNPLTIDNFSGSTILVYDHGDNDGTNVAHYAAGDTIINSAAEGSLITLSTDSRNINVNDRDNVDAVMSALSQKLAYVAAGSDTNLQGQVQISGGLTSDKIALWLGDLTFDAENGGLGQFTAGSSHRNYTTAESEFVQGTRTAIMSNMLSWRDVAASSYNLRNMRRGQEAKGGAGPVDMGSRLAGADEGTWARVYGGQTKYSGNNTSFDGDYWAAQVGYDKQLANGWTMGVAIDYQDGSDSYKTGSGDTKLYGLGFYGSKELAANSYLDLTARLGHVKNEFSASNETGKIDGDYSANGFSLSAQYSMRFGDDEKGYLEPQAQLTWARMGSSDFTAHGSLGSLHVNQDAMNSFVGRIGLEAGQASEHGNYFARISLAHEFAGDVDTSFVDSYGGTKATSYDLGGTWSELTVGGTFNLSKSLHFYGDVTKGLTGYYKQDWKVNAGLRFTF